MFLPENQHECVGLMVSPGNHVSVCEHGHFNRLLYIDGLSLNYGLVGTIVSDEPNNFFLQFVAVLHCRLKAVCGDFWNTTRVRQFFEER